jgi:hypothetical protein
MRGNIMKKTGRVFAAALALIFLLLACLLSACASGESVLSAGAPSTESNAAPSPVPTATPVPTPSPTPTLSPEEIKTAKLNQEFQDFLNKEGEFTPEKIFSQLIEFYCSKGTNLITKYEDWSSYDKRKFGLGLSSIQPHIQGYLFDYFESEGRIILILGFDGADGTRFISPVEIPFYVVEGAQRHFGVNKSSVNNMDGVDYSIQRDTWTTGECSESIEISDKTTLFSILDSLKGKVIAFFLEEYEWDRDLSKSATFLAKSAAAQNCLIDFQNEVNSKVDLAFALLHSVTDNNIKINEWSGGDEKEIYRLIMDADGNAILRIESADHLEDIDISKVPLLVTFEWYDGPTATPQSGSADSAQSQPEY